jgi:NAD(P)H-hydrate epimerase
LQRDVEGDLAAIIGRIAASGKTVLAIDMPTGVDSDTGSVCGTVLPAHFTAALGLLKFGHVLQPGKRLSGKIALGDIGLSTQASRALASGEQLNDSLVAAMLPERPEDANKGTFGKAMIVAGSINYIGAASLASEGAMRSGVGLVTLACAGDLLRVVATQLKECTFLPLPSDLGAIAAPAAENVKSAIEGYTALLVGCGLGNDKETVQFLRRLLQSQEAPTRSIGRGMGFATRVLDNKSTDEEKKPALPPLVLDADALNILSEWEDWPSSVPEGSVLTPHPGEMARLMGGTVDDVQKDRVGVAKDCAARWKQVVVLKGAATVIASPDGKVCVSPFSNPALATAGTGDVLAGAIAGLLAQGIAPREAACAGVYIHGMAGELLREEYGVAGGLAGDLPVLMARAQRTIRESVSADGT